MFSANPAWAKLKKFYNPDTNTINVPLTAKQSEQLAAITGVENVKYADLPIGDNDRRVVVYDYLMRELGSVGGQEFSNSLNTRTRR